MKTRMIYEELEIVKYFKNIKLYRERIKYSLLG